MVGQAAVTTKSFLKISNKVVCLTSYQVEVVHNTRKLPPSFTFTTFGSTWVIEKAEAAPTRNRLEMSSFMLIWEMFTWRTDWVLEDNARCVRCRCDLSIWNKEKTVNDIFSNTDQRKTRFESLIVRIEQHRRHYTSHYVATTTRYEGEIFIWKNDFHQKSR